MAEPSTLVRWIKLFLLQDGLGLAYSPLPLLCLPLLCVSLLTMQNSQSADNFSTTATAVVTTSDQQFLLGVGQANLTEIKLGELAETHGQSKEVKHYGAQMAQQYAEMNDKLKSLASAKGISLPSKLDDHHQQITDGFASLSGPGFDRAYLQEMTTAHATDLADFKKQAVNTRDHDLNNFFVTTIPMIQDHLQQIKSISSESK